MSVNATEEELIILMNKKLNETLSKEQAQRRKDGEVNYSSSTHGKPAFSIEQADQLATSWLDQQDRQVISRPADTNNHHQPEDNATKRNSPDIYENLDELKVKYAPSQQQDQADGIEAVERTYGAQKKSNKGTKQAAAVVTGDEDYDYDEEEDNESEEEDYDNESEEEDDESDDDNDDDNDNTKKGPKSVKPKKKTIGLSDALDSADLSSSLAEQQKEKTGLASPTSNKEMEAKNVEEATLSATSPQSVSVSRTPAKPESLEKKEKITTLKKKNNLSEDFEVKSSQKKKSKTKAGNKSKSKSKRAAGKELKKGKDTERDTKKDIPAVDTKTYSSTPGPSSGDWQKEGLTQPSPDIKPAQQETVKNKADSHEKNDLHVIKFKASAQADQQHQSDHEARHHQASPRDEKAGPRVPQSPHGYKPNSFNTKPKRSQKAELEATKAEIKENVNKMLLDDQQVDSEAQHRGRQSRHYYNSPDSAAFTYNRVEVVESSDNHSSLTVLTGLLMMMLMFGGCWLYHAIFTNRQRKSWDEESAAPSNLNSVSYVSRAYLEEPPQRKVGGYGLPVTGVPTVSGLNEVIKMGHTKTIYLDQMFGLPRKRSTEKNASRSS